MYSFAQRPDTAVIDEPFYANYLMEHPEVEHPGRNEVLTALPTNHDDIIAGIDLKSDESPVVFVKNMGHHLTSVNPEFMLGYTNVFLIRNPKPLIASLAEIIPNPIMRDVGLARQVQLFEFLQTKTGQVPLVIDSEVVLSNPAMALRKICGLIEIPYTDAMLSWPRGMMYGNAPWAKYWYKNVMNSEGFEKQTSSARPFPERCLALLLESTPYYQKLKEHSIKL